MHARFVPDRRMALRFLAVTALAVWIGGFTFYGGVVVPILEDAVGRFEAGMITRRATHRLNLVGLVALILLWALLAVDPRSAKRGAFYSGLALLVLSTTTLAILAWAHAVMDRRLDTVGLRGFRPWHRFYLMMSTLQWASNLGMLALCLGAGSSGSPPAEARPAPPRHPEDSPEACRA